LRPILICRATKRVVRWQLSGVVAFVGVAHRLQRLDGRKPGGVIGEHVLDASVGAVPPAAATGLISTAVVQEREDLTAEIPTETDLVRGAVFDRKMPQP